MDTDKHSDKYYSTDEHGTPDEYADLDAYTDAVSLAHAYRSYRDTNGRTFTLRLSDRDITYIHRDSHWHKLSVSYRNANTDAGTHTDTHADL
jgi:hypothetical protein